MKTKAAVVAALVAIGLPGLLAAQEETLVRKIRLLDAETAMRGNGRPRDIVFEVMTAGAKRIVTIPATTDTTSVNEFFEAGPALIVIGERRGRWVIHRLNLENGELVLSIPTPHRPVVSPDRQLIAYIQNKPRLKAFGGDTVMILDTASGARRVGFPEPDACFTEELVPEADEHFLVFIGRAFLWSRDSQTVLLTAAPDARGMPVHLVAVGATVAPADALWVARRDIGLVVPGDEKKSTDGVIFPRLKSLTWLDESKVRAVFDSDTGGEPVSLDAAAPQPAAFNCGVEALSLLGEVKEVSGAKIRWTLPFLWWTGVAEDGTPAYREGVQHLFIDRPGRRVVAARYAFLHPSDDVKRAVPYLSSLLGLDLRPVVSDETESCPGEACWTSQDGESYRLAVQRGAFVILVSGYDLLTWDDIGVEGSTRDQQIELARSIAGWLLDRASARGGEAAMK